MVVPAAPKVGDLVKWKYTGDPRDPMNQEEHPDDIGIVIEIKRWDFDEPFSKTFDVILVNFFKGGQQWVSPKSIYVVSGKEKRG